MFKLIKNFKLTLLLICLFSLCLECFIFNHSFFFQPSSDNIKISLPFNSNLGYHAQIINSKNPQLVINKINKPIYKLRVATLGEETLINGKIMLTDDASSVALRNIGTFSVNPGGENNFFTVNINPNGNIHSLIIEFSNLRSNLSITSIELNPSPDFNFSFIRFITLEILLSIVYLIIHFKFYNETLDLNKKSHKIINYLCIILCLSISIFYFIFTNPMTSTSMIWDMPSYDLVQLGNPQKSLLLPYPTSKEELKHHDIFVKQMDAFNKGQLNFDVYIDPRQNLVSNPYDQGLLTANNIDYYLEASFYNGKYYSYYGLTPIFTIYYPIYFLTGKVPSPGLACGILSFLSVLALFFAIKQALLFYKITSCNALIFFIGEIAVIAGSFIFVNQAMLRHYQIQNLCGILFSSILIGSTFIYLSDRISNKYIKYLNALIISISIVAVVSSRQMAFIIIIFFFIPLFSYSIFHKLINKKLNYIETLCLCIPTVLGAIAIMIYNYARFDSPFEFGFTYQITGSDHRYDTISLTLQNIWSAIYHYLLESPHTVKNFPFFEVQLWEYQDYGSYKFISTASGLLGIPLMCGIMLSICLFIKNGFNLFKNQISLSQIPASIHRYSIISLIIGLFVVYILSFLKTSGVCYQYISDTSVLTGIISLILILIFINNNESVSSGILIFITIYYLIYTIFFGFFLPLESSGLLPGMNPDLYIDLIRIFSPFSI